MMKLIKISDAESFIIVQDNVARHVIPIDNDIVFSEVFDPEYHGVCFNEMVGTYSICVEALL